MKHRALDLSMEITVLSAQDLNNPSSSLLFLSRRLRPFVALFATASALHHSDGLPTPVHRTRIDDRGEQNPTWGDTIRLPLDSSFVLGGGASVGDADEAGVYICVLSERLLGSPARLGWCRIPPSDVIDGLRPPTAPRRLSYALRSPRHGGRGHGVIHVAVRLLGQDLDRLLAPPPPAPPMPQEPRWGLVAIGIPVAAFSLPGCASGTVATGQIARFREGREGFGAGSDFGLKYPRVCNRWNSQDAV